MSRWVEPRSLGGGPEMPASVLRRRPADVVTPPRQRRPAPATEPPPPRRRSDGQLLPPPPPTPARRLFQRPPRRPLPAPRPVRGRPTVPIGVVAAALVFLGLFAVAAGIGAATGFDIRDLFRGPPEPPPRAFPVL